MVHYEPVREVIDLTAGSRNCIFNMTVEEARTRVAAGDPARVLDIDGHFALVGRTGHLVRLARTLGVPMRYFIAKQVDGPALVVAHRIEDIRSWLCGRNLQDQFHPSYTRMVPAHYITEIALLGCPDPNPVYHRYFSPQRNDLPADITAIGSAYIGAVAVGVSNWLHHIPADAPVGVCFSGGIDSTAVLAVTHHVMLRSGMNPARLKAFTLCVDGGGPDLDQARAVVDGLDLQVYLEAIDVPVSAVNPQRAIELMEDYKPLDVEAGAMTLALVEGIRERYPEWTYLVDGDGGDENLKDYPIEENPELTIRSVLNNPLLYHEGWGVESIKHSLTYSGGLSRGITRSAAILAARGFSGFSPYMLPSVVGVSESIPFIELTDWDHDKLYALKGTIVQRGVEAVTGLTMPVFDKRRFQHGAMDRARFDEQVARGPQAYRQMFQELF